MNDRELIENTGEEAAVRERLHHAIDILCEDAALVELWACALTGFAQAAPDYSNPFAIPAAEERGSEVAA